MADKTTIMKEAHKFVLKGQIDKAIAEWEKLIRDAPDGNTYNIVGDLYLKKGDKKKATEYLHRSANYFRDEGFSLKALALYKKVLNIDPADAGALKALGQLSEEKGLTTDAIKYYLATADCYSKEGKKDELLETYEKILGLSPSNVPLRIKVAEIFLKEGLVSGATKEFIFIAQLYWEKGESQKAQEFYRKVLELQPSNKEAVLGITALLEKAGDLNGAVAQMKALAALMPQDRPVLLRYSQLLTTAGRDAEAEKILISLREADPADLATRRFLGDIYIKSGQEEKAWQEYIPVIDQLVAEEKFDNAINLLELFRRVDPIETGSRLVTLFTQLRDDDRLVAELVALGEIYQEKDLPEDAAACFRQAAEVKPYDEDLQRRLGDFATIEEAAPASAEAEVKDSINIVSGAEKTADEIFVETDIFSRYGLLNEAVKLLEGLKVREPYNIEVHLRLKALYAETADTESAVTECLILNELYSRNGDAGNAEKALKEAADISPDDPRLKGRVEPPPAFEPTAVFEPTSYASAPEEGAEIEDYEDALAEADFYIRQGLTQEAAKILEKMHRLLPGNKDISERLESIGQITESFGGLSPDASQGGLGERQMTGPASEEITPEPAGLAGEYEIPDLGDMETLPPDSEFAAVEDRFDLPQDLGGTAAGLEAGVAGWQESGGELSAEELQLPGGTGGEPLSDEEAAPEVSQALPAGAKEAPENEYEDLLLTDQDLVEAEEMPELALDNDVLEIFQEFKKGLEKELGDEDSETHYNLGIAYKEMGLTDDAIKEFQSSREDPKRFIQSSTMLGVCYMEKGLYSLAIDALLKVTLQVTEKDESYWPVRYDLAEAYEKNNNLKEALELYTSVYGWNAKFRGVAEKVPQVSAQLGRTAKPKGGEGEKPRDKKDRVSYL